WKTLPGAREWPTLREWYGFWGQPQTSDSIQAPVALQGADLLQRLSQDVTAVGPGDFRLPPGSPGKGPTRGGKDFGADVDAAGPGAAYSRWRQTADYRDWQRRVERLMSEEKEAR